MSQSPFKLTSGWCIKLKKPPLGRWTYPATARRFTNSEPAPNLSRVPHAFGAADVSQRASSCFRQISSKFHWLFSRKQLCLCSSQHSQHEVSFTCASSRGLSTFAGLVYRGGREFRSWCPVRCRRCCFLR